MSTKYPQGVITATPPFQSTTAQNFSGVWTMEQLANNFYYYKQAIANSLRFRSSASAYLNRTPSVAGNRQTWTFSAWIKLGALTGAQRLFSANESTTPFTFIAYNTPDSTGSANCIQVATSGGASNGMYTVPIYRDPSSWYHLVVAMDTTQATASDRTKVYINGVQVNLTTGTWPTLNQQTTVNSAAVHNIGRATGGSNYFDGYMAEVNFIDGQALDPSYFGQLSTITGVWAPKAYTGAYGTNGFRLNFSNGTSTTTLGYDSSGNSNNWTTNNISLTSGSTYDWMLDSPTPFAGGSYGVGNYCVMNAASIGSDCTLSDGNLGVAYGSSGTIKSTMATIGMSSGKFYCEFSLLGGSSPSPAVGISSKASASDMPEYIGYNSYGWSYYVDGTKRNNAAGGGSYSYGATWTTGDVIGIAFDADAGSLTFYKNGATQGVAFTGLTSGPYYVGIGDGGGTPTFNGAFNFGQRPFAYTPPSGHKSLCTFNLPDPSIANGANHMAATLYTGNGATQTIVNANNSVSFRPDFVWIKDRNVSSAHALTNSVVGITKYLESNTTLAETTDTTSVTALNSNGFSLGAGTSIYYTNRSGESFVAWQWKAGGTAVTNTAGSITSSVSANAAAGFSVVTYTGTGANATVGHGLGVAPSMVIVKPRNGTTTYGWRCYHISLGATKYILLNDTASAGTFTDWNNTAPTSTVVNLGSGSPQTVVESGTNYVAYCFAAIPGYSAFGSYTGNGSADGPFVYCGFRPRFILIKRTDSAVDWMLFDTSRNTYNAVTGQLNPNTSAAEDNTYTWIDVVSNGFKCRVSLLGTNASGGTYIYAAFAENPFKYSLAR